MHRAAVLTALLAAPALAASAAEDWLARPWPTAWLRAATLELEAQVGRVETPFVDLEAVRVPLRVRGGVARLAGLQARIAGAALVGEAILDARRDPPALSVKLEAEGVPLSSLKPLAAVVRGGEARISVMLEGTGGRPRAWLAAARGRILVTAHGGRLVDDALERLAQDALMALVRALSPGQGESGGRLECLVARFEVRDGVAVSDGGIGLETTRVWVIGGGRVDLTSGALDLVFRPRAREGLGIGAGELASLVRVGGTLSRPELRPNPAGLLKKGVSWGAAFATLGLSKLAEIAWDQVAERRGACRQALGSGAEG